MSKSPVAVVKDKFGEKSKLVAALAPFTGDEGLWVKRLNEGKGLERVSNAKLLKLFRVFSAVKEKFGTREKLVDAICELEKRVKDAGYKARISAYPVPRLYDLFVSASKRAGLKVAPLVNLRDGAPAAGSVKAAPPAKSEKAAAKKKPAAKASGGSAKPAKARSKSKAASGKTGAGKAKKK